MNSGRKVCLNFGALPLSESPRPKEPANLIVPIQVGAPIKPFEGTKPHKRMKKSGTS